MIKMTLSQKNDESSVLSIEGALTVANINSLHKKIVELLSQTSSLELNIKQAEAIDLTFIQLMCSSHRAFGTKGKLFSISGDKASFYGRTDCIGFTRHKGCHFQKDSSCVLIKEA
jgi:anti-anti-sigma regulatory factor